MNNEASDRYSKYEHEYTYTERMAFHNKMNRIRDIWYLLIVSLLAIILVASTDGCAVQPPKIPAPTIKQEVALTPSIPKDVTSKPYNDTPIGVKNDAPPGSYKLNVQATAYWTHDPVDASGHGIAFDGTPAVAYKTCAVDPKVIPLGSKVYVKEFGWLRANDTGNAIKGNIIDIAMPSREAAWKWGRRNITVFVQPPKKKG